jgi:hypothetical protein
MGKRVAMSGGVRGGVLIVLAALATGCFYLDDINVRPVADLRETPETIGPHHRGDRVVLSATKTTDDNDDVRLLDTEWNAHACNADGTDCDPLPFAGSSSHTVLDPIALDIPDWRADEVTAVTGVRVLLEVIDPHGARAGAELFLPVLNRDPTLSFRRQGLGNASSYPIGVPVDIYVMPADPDPADVDSLVVENMLAIPPKRAGSSGGLLDVDADGLHGRLFADVPGTWTITADVVDQLGGRGTGEVVVVIDDDAPPCITGTSPVALEDATYIVDALEGARYFAVTSVTDDLDAYPPGDDDVYGDWLGQATFRWAIATPATGGAFVALSGHDLPDYLLDPAAYDPGDELRVRVEVDDRIGRTPSCAPDQPSCSVGGNACVQRLTWEVQIR